MEDSPKGVDAPAEIRLSMDGGGSAARSNLNRSQRDNVVVFFGIRAAKRIGAYSGEDYWNWWSLLEKQK